MTCRWWNADKRYAPAALPKLFAPDGTALLATLHIEKFADISNLIADNLGAGDDASPVIDCNVQRFVLTS